MVTNPSTPLMNSRADTPYCSRATNSAPAVATASVMMVRSGIASATARMRGATSRCTGSAPSARTASSCSVTAMPPSSAAMPAPIRPPATSAVRIGPSSRTTAVTVVCPMYSLAPKRSRP